MSKSPYCVRLSAKGVAISSPTANRNLVVNSTGHSGFTPLGGMLLRWASMLPRPTASKVSIPSRESVLLRPESAGAAWQDPDRFQSLPGNLCFCGPVVRLNRVAMSLFQSLPGNLCFCGGTWRCCRLRRCGFNPFQGICASAAMCQFHGHLPSLVFQSLPGNLCFCGAGPATGRYQTMLFQSLPGNLCFCGCRAGQLCIFKQIALNARASLSETPTDHRSISNLSF